MAVTSHMLTHVGFSPRQAAGLEGYVAGTTTDSQLHRANFSTHQLRCLQQGPWTLAKLLHGGFTKAQATLILDLGT